MGEERKYKKILRTLGKIRNSIDIANLPGDALNALKTIGKVGYGIAGLGVVSDVIKPIGNLVPYFIGAAITLVVIGVVFFIAQRKERLKIIAYGAVVFIVVSVILLITPFEGILGRKSNVITNAQVYIARKTSGDDARAKVILLKKRLQSAIERGEKKGTADSDIIERAREINAIDPRVLQESAIIRNTSLEDIMRVSEKNPNLLFRDFKKITR